jgi:hypothetical protein
MSKKRIKFIFIFVVGFSLGILGLISLNAQTQLHQKECPKLECPQAQTTTVECPKQDCPTGEDSQPDYSTIPLNSPQKNLARLFSSPVQYLEKESQATGQGFSGKATRVFKGKREYSGHRLKFAPSDSAQNTACKRWAVVTTIFEPSEAVRRQVRLEGWCLVVVADESSAKEYNTGWTKGEGNGAVIYLTPEEQKAMNVPFVDALPWNHFGRKNVGYMYAIQHGAEVIWDFDDDNMLKFWMSGAAPPGAPSLDASLPNKENCANDHMEVLLPKGHNWPTYNPYPSLGAPYLPSWPRGLPLDDIKVASSFNTTLEKVIIDCSEIGVLQSLADYQPDVDAIFRFTQPIPFWFKRSQEKRHLLVPSGVMTPYNAQATLHFSSGFFGLLLPIAVNSRVSDIWRSYFTQRLFWDVGLKLGFAARPLVVQDSNGNSSTNDLAGENDLYLKGKQLIKFLGQWKSSSQTIVERTEELWIALYERDYIAEEDVKLVQLWLQFLVDVGYKFPLIKGEQSSVSVPSFPTPSNHTVTKVSGEETFTEEFVQSFCKSAPALKIVTGDRHTGTRIDIPTVLGSVGQSAIVINDKYVSNQHPHAFKLEGISMYDNISPSLDQIIPNMLKSLNEQPKNFNMINEDMIRKNFEFYKNDETVATADAFFCSFPACICEMWLPFNKTIILGPAHRYNVWMCTPGSFDRLNDHLYKLKAMNKLVLGAGSQYDKEYLRHYTGMNPLPLYSSCGVYTNGNPYSPTREEILMIGGRSMDEGAVVKEMSAAVKKFKVVHYRSLYTHYAFSDLVKHRAVIFVTYAVMCYKVCELYALNIPMIVPSIKFYRTIFKGFGGDRVTHGGFYCPKDKEVGKPHPTSLHPYSPNVYAANDQEAESYWLQFADFNHWPHVTYFDNYEQLDEVLSKMDFNDIHDKMVIENNRRLLNLKYSLCTAAHRIDKTREGSTFPKNYNEAIQQIYGVNDIQEE